MSDAEEKEAPAAAAAACSCKDPSKCDARQARVKARKEAEKKKKTWQEEGFLAPDGEWRSTLLTTDDMPEEEMRALIAKYTPVVKLHHDEDALPCTPEWYMQHAQLRFGGRTKK